MDDQQKFYCYLLSIKKRTLVYIGYSENLKRRVEQHKAGRGALFTKKYSVFELIYFEEFLSKEKAKSREKQLKNASKILGKYYTDPAANTSSLTEGLGIINGIFEKSYESIERILKLPNGIDKIKRLYKIKNKNYFQK
jgi:putative endonuclease